jgi:hypothetical protein
MFRDLPSRLALALLQLADSGMGERNPKVAAGPAWQQPPTSIEVGETLRR